MSYALETKKRKFTRVLESLSKPLTPGDGGAKPVKDPLMAARQRLADATHAPSIKRVRVGEGTGDNLTINEVEWAKRGWSCTDYMRVACVGGCGASIVVKLPEEVDDFEDLDSEKVQERKDVRECYIHLKSAYFSTE